MARFYTPSAGGGDTFDIVYTTHNSDGTNVKIGDDAWLGDIDAGNTVNVMGVENSAEGYVSMGSNGQVYVGNDGNNNLILNAPSGNLQMWMDGAAYIGDAVSDNRIAQIKDLNDVPQRFASGAFHDETTFGPYSANSEQALSFQSTDWSNNVRIAGINNSEIILDKAGKYNIQFSTQLHVTNGGAVVYIWLKKNGTTVPWTGTRLDMNANSPYTVAAWNWFVTASAGDYYEIFWSTPSDAVKVEAVTGLTGTKASVPSNILTVNQVG